MATVGRYRVLEEIGRGELTIVYKATDPVLNRTVAVKVFPAQFASGTSQDRDWRQSFKREVESAGKLDHPGIVRLLDAGFDDAQGHDYVVLEFVDGRPLGDLLGERALALAARLGLAVELAEALTHAHAQGVVHLQLRPSNVLVTHDLHAKVADFGLATLNAQVGDSTPVPGTLRMFYRAPEQIYGKKADERTDVFALGVLLYEMLLGRRPFDGQSWAQVTQKILNVPPPYLKDSSGELPQPLVFTLSRALAKNALDRFQTMRDMLQELQAVRHLYGERGLPEPRTPAAFTPPLALALAPGAPPGIPHLVVEEDGAARVVPLTKDEFTIGRRNENDLAIRDEHVSRSHARLTKDGDRWVLRDLDSKHGTFVRGERIESQVLGDGDAIRLGRGSRVNLVFKSGEGSLSDTTASTLAELEASEDRHTDLLLEVSRALNSSLSLDDVLNVIIDSALSFSRAERGFVLLREAEGSYKTRVFRHAAGAQVAPGEDVVSTSAVEKCLQTEQPVIIHNTEEAADFARKESVLGLGLKLILCVPLIYRGEVLGVLYLDSRQGKSPFRTGQLELLNAFAATAATALENARLYEMATVDALTGVYLRHHFDARLSEEFQRAVRHNSVLSVVFMDVDHFKKINDAHGHAVGDRVLRTVAATLKSVARNTDVIGRYGGEEFVLLAPQTRMDAAEALADRIRLAVADLSLASDSGAGLSTTISLGLACYPQTGVSGPAELIKAADTALLLAKSQGRNRLCVSGR